jgi:putative transposase
MSQRSHSQLYFHYVWSTYERKPIIDPQWEYRLYGYIISKCKVLCCIPLAIGGTNDHLHLLLRARPESTPSDIIGKIKGSSSHFINDELSTKHFSWQKGYGIFSVYHDHFGIVVSYIKNQKKHHSANTILIDLEEIVITDRDSFDTTSMPDCIFGD